MIEITVNGETHRYTEDKIVIGSSLLSDLRLRWIDPKDLTLHFNEIGYYVEVHSEEGFEYKNYYLLKESRREDKMIRYGDTFKIGYNCKPEYDDARGDRDYHISVVKC